MWLLKNQSGQRLDAPRTARGHDLVGEGVEHEGAGKQPAEDQSNQPRSLSLAHKLALPELDAS
jgi:hypothetical protein